MGDFGAGAVGCSRFLCEVLYGKIISKSNTEARNGINKSFPATRKSGTGKGYLEKKAERPVHETRWQATRSGTRRGIIFGSKVSGVLIVISVLMNVHAAMGRSKSFIDPSDDFLDIVQEIAKVLGSFIYVFALLTAICAISGGILMGLIETIRFRKPK